MLWEKLVDTGVRGVVHEGPEGEEIARASVGDLADPAGVVAAIEGDDGLAAVDSSC